MAGRVISYITAQQIENRKQNMFTMVGNISSWQKKKRAKQKSSQSEESTVKRDPLKPRTKISVTGLFWEAHPQTLPYERAEVCKEPSYRRAGIIYEGL